MSENPYAPPKAVVDDVPLEAEMERPREIKLVVQIAVISYLIGLIVMAISWDYYAQLQSVTSTILGQLFSVTLLTWIYYKIYQGRNWARIAWLVFALLGVVGMVVAYPAMSATLPTLSKVQMAFGFALSILQFWWLFISPGKHWFRRNRREPLPTGDYTKAK